MTFLSFLGEDEHLFNIVRQEQSFPFFFPFLLPPALSCLSRSPSALGAVCLCVCAQCLQHVSLSSVTLEGVDEYQVDNTHTHIKKGKDFLFSKKGENTRKLLKSPRSAPSDFFSVAPWRLPCQVPPGLREGLSSLYTLLLELKSSQSWPVLSSQRTCLSFSLSKTLSNLFSLFET